MSTRNDCAELAQVETTVPRRKCLRIPVGIEPKAFRVGHEGGQSVLDECAIGG